MAKRYWIAKWSMGYVGTDSDEPIDLVEHTGLSEEEIEEMDDSEALREVEEFAWEQAKEMIESYAEPDDERNGD
jgi:hypothetical protein